MASPADAVVDADPGEPTTWAICAKERILSPPGPDQSLLHRVLGFAFVAEDGQSDGEKPLTLDARDIIKRMLAGGIAQFHTGC
jgi:hypothetical protein